MSQNLPPLNSAASSTGLLWCCTVDSRIDSKKKGVESWIDSFFCEQRGIVNRFLFSLAGIVNRFQNFKAFSIADSFLTFVICFVRFVSFSVFVFTSNWGNWRTHEYEIQMKRKKPAEKKTSESETLGGKWIEKRNFYKGIDSSGMESWKESIPFFLKKEGNRESIPFLQEILESWIDSFFGEKEGNRESIPFFGDLPNPGT